MWNSDVASVDNWRSDEYSRATPIIDDSQAKDEK